MLNWIFLQKLILCNRINVPVRFETPQRRIIHYCTCKNWQNSHTTYLRLWKVPCCGSNSGLLLLLSGVETSQFKDLLLDLSEVEPPAPQPHLNPSINIYFWSMTFLGNKVPNELGHWILPCSLSVSVLYIMMSIDVVITHSIHRYLSSNILMFARVKLIIRMQFHEIFLKVCKI